MENNDKLGMQGLNLAQTTPVICEHCGGQVFDQALVLRKVSSILTGTGQAGLVPVTVFVCSKCNTIVKEFLPEEMKDMDFGEETNDCTNDCLVATFSSSKSDNNGK